LKDISRRVGDDDISRSLEAIVNIRIEMDEERKMARSLEKEENRMAEERKAVMDERMAVSQERLAVTEEWKVSMEERRVAMEKTLRLMEQEKHLFFTDTSNLDGKQKEYINLCRDHVLAQKRMMRGWQCPKSRQ
jgi:hypothetical protein